MTTLTIIERSVPVTLEAVGRTEGAKEVEIRARVSGIIEKRLYAEGAYVKAGAPLFQIERAPFEIALARARADADQATATRDQARRETERVAGLYKSSAVSQRIAEESETAYRSALAAYDAAQARVREAQLNLSYTSVTAPISGVTGRALHSEGSLVTANNETSLLTTVSQTNPIWVRFALSEAEHAGLRRSQGNGDASVELVLADGKPYEATGHLNFAGSTVDRQLGTVQLRAEFTNPQMVILPGQFATVRIGAGNRQVIAVPQSAVVQGNQSRYVWTVDAQGKAAQRPVETGTWTGSDWIIRSGLAPGDRIIVDNLMKLNPGSELTIAPAVATDAPALGTAAAAR
ncbi:efflux RND transporter periplasmic adaptor subunit [Povalibacter sp.]|uniref:efflux RND transporter periplasmic adaptor subunit n=1 Tax=Povalibacter sp. TaxID=1962978 RepID=UPI002F40F1B4